MHKELIGRRIQNARKENGLTQEELAQRLDMSTKYISNIECGEKLARMETFISITNVLKTDANTLLQDVLDYLPGTEEADVFSRIKALPVNKRNQLIRIIEAYLENID